MFKLSIPIVKSYVGKNSNTLVIEWIASDTTIDRDSERFSDTAVKSMSESVNLWNIPIKIEHQDNIFSEVWVWKEATITEDWKMFVKWELDLDLSMSKDIQVLLNKGFQIALSVGWMVKDAVSEFNADLWKSIKTYTDILLKEISIVKNPANFNATLSIAKSFNIDSKEETEEAMDLDKIASYSIKASDNFVKAISEVEALIKSTIVKDITKWCKRKVSKNWWTSCELEISCDCCEMEEEYETTELTYLDYRIMWMVYRIYASIWADEIKVPDWLDFDSIYMLPDYSFLPLQSDNRLIPYMDINMKIRKDWVIYSMYKLAKWEYGWISAEDRVYAMEFLYSAFKQLTTTSAKNFKDIRPITSDEIVLMQKCVNYKVGKWIRPQYDWNDLSDVEVNKLAKAYSVLNDRGILKTNSDITMNEQELRALIAKYTADLTALEVIKSETLEVTPEIVPEITPEVVEEVVTEVTPEIAPEIIEEVISEVVEEIVTEEVTKDVVSEEVVIATEELNADTTKNNTSIDEASLLKSLTTIVENAIKGISESTANSISDLEKSIDTKIAWIQQTNEESISKSTKAKADLEIENSKALEKMASLVENLSETVKSYWETGANRKSYATAIQKGYTDKELSKSFEEKVSDEMAKNGWNFATARATVLAV